MSFTIHTTRFLTKEQVVLLNQESLDKQSPAAQPQEIVDALDEGRYVVQAAKVNTDTEQVRARVLVNIGMIPYLWVEMSLEDWRMLPVAEIPGDDETWNSLPLEIQDRTDTEDG
jgi:hypothetical protein